MKNIYLIAMDASAGSHRALDFAITHAKLSGASIVMTHVIDWSPYSFHTAEELAERHKRRDEEIDRAKEAILTPMVSTAEKAGVAVEVIVRHGRGAETLATIADEIDAAQIIIGRSGDDRLKSRVFGTTSSKLVQISDVPVVVVP